MGIKVVANWSHSLKIIKQNIHLVYPLLHIQRRDQLDNFCIIFRILAFINLLIVVHFPVFQGFLCLEPYFCSLRFYNGSSATVVSCKYFFFVIEFVILAY